MICSVEGCSRDECARGLCRKHYDQVRYHGHVVKPVQKKKLCFMCGAYFDVGSHPKDFCGATCRKRYERAKRKGNAPRRGLNKVITAEDVFKPEPVEEIAVVRESFTDRDVWEECGHVCYECGERIGEADVLDSGWLLPIEAGGERVLKNRVALHTRCKARWERRPARGRAKKASVARKRRDS